jgi:lipopolysaccharide export LptBFGC system permease protein LptF
MIYDSEPMKLIDKYIFQKFLSTYVYTVLLINAIICVIDYGEKSDDFMKPELTFGMIVVDYYFNFIVYMTNMLSPVTVFIATVFVTARLASRTEIVAILAGGVSFRRLLLPYLMGSGLLAMLTFVLGHSESQQNTDRFRAGLSQKPILLRPTRCAFQSSPQCFCVFPKLQQHCAYRLYVHYRENS